MSYVIVAHNERDEVDAKLANTAALDYPADRLEVIFASDGSDDGTDARVGEIWRPQLGRPAPDAALAAAPGQERGAERRRRRRVGRDPRVQRRGQPSRAGRDPPARRSADRPRRSAPRAATSAMRARGGEGERAYWSFDRLWKRLASRAGSMTSATGQIYAIRAALFEPVPDGVTDDFFVSTGAIAAGKRLWFAEDAVATGPVASSARAEFRRKVRVTARGLASVLGAPRAARPAPPRLLRAPAVHAQGAAPRARRSGRGRIRERDRARAGRSRIYAGAAAAQALVARRRARWLGSCADHTPSPRGRSRCRSTSTSCSRRACSRWSTSLAVGAIWSGSRSGSAAPVRPRWRSQLMHPAALVALGIHARRRRRVCICGPPGFRPTSPRCSTRTFPIRCAPNTACPRSSCSSRRRCVALAIARHVFFAERRRPGLERGAVVARRAGGR